MSLQASRLTSWLDADRSRAFVRARHSLSWRRPERSESRKEGALRLFQPFWNAVRAKPQLCWRLLRMLSSRVASIRPVDAARNDLPIADHPSHRYWQLPPILILV